MFKIIQKMTAIMLTTSALCLIATYATAQSATDDSESFSPNDKYLRLGTTDRHITLSPFIQMDGGYRDYNGTERDLTGNTRLARFYLFAKNGPLGFTGAIDAENEDFPWRYAFASYQVTKALTLKAGQQDEPFSLQDYSGSRFLPFAEGGQSAALIPGDNVGLLLDYGGSNYSLTGGIFGGDVNNGVDEKGVAVTGRATWAPIYEEDEITRQGDAAQSGVGTQRVNNLLHLGLAASVRKNNDKSLSVAGSTNSSLITQSIADAPSFKNADSISRLNFELARSIGALSFQSELTAADIDAPEINGTATGGYLYTTYFLTGERRGYSRSGGTFGRVIPKNPIDEGGYGAYEIGGRIDYLDLSDLGDNAGAQFGISAVGNAYLTKRITLTSDYSYTQGLDSAKDTDSHALTFRLQYAY